MSGGSDVYSNQSFLKFLINTCKQMQYSFITISTLKKFIRHYIQIDKFRKSYFSEIKNF